VFGQALYGEVVATGTEVWELEADMATSVGDGGWLIAEGGDFSKYRGDRRALTQR
jgi:hypothetical protein